MNESMKAITDVQRDVLVLNVDQLKHGRNKKGGRIGEYRSAWYGDMKARMNPSADGYVDLILTGAFANAFFLEMANRGYKIGSRDGKASRLQENYGEDIYGLNLDYKQKLVDMSYYNALMVRVRNVTKL